jgi:hypothetical protein
MSLEKKFELKEKIEKRNIGDILVTRHSDRKGDYLTEYGREHARKDTEDIYSKYYGDYEIVKSGGSNAGGKVKVDGMEMGRALETANIIADTLVGKDKYKTTCNL